MYLHMNAKEMSSILTITASIASFGTQMTAYLHIYVASVVKCLVIVILYVPNLNFMPRTSSWGLGMKLMHQIIHQLSL